MQHAEHLLSLEDKSLKGEPLSSQEIVFAQDLLTSTNLVARIVGAEALLKSSASEIAKREALECLLSLCGSVSRDPDVVSRLAWSLSIIPYDRLFRSEELKSFAYNAVNSEARSSRLNAIVLLGRLAKLGDERSIKLLKSKVTDPDEYVRHNATNFLKDLKTS